MPIENAGNIKGSVSDEAMILAQHGAVWLNFTALHVIPAKYRHGIRVTSAFVNGRAKPNGAT